MKKSFVLVAFLLLLLPIAGCLKEKGDLALQTDIPKPIQSEPGQASQDLVQAESQQALKDNITNNLMNLGINQGFVVSYEDSILLTFKSSDNLIYKVDPKGSVSEAFNGVKASQLLTANGGLYITNNTPEHAMPFGLFKFDPKGPERNLIYANDRQQIFGVYADDDWVYYCTYNVIACEADNPPAGEEPRTYSFYTLYRIGANGGEPEEVLNHIYNLHLPYISEGWIYYSTMLPEWVAEQENLGEKEEGFYKIKLDGTGKAKLWDMVPFSPIVKEGDWLYYSAGGAYRQCIDGSEQVKICEDPVAAVNVKDNWVYFTSFADELCLYKMDWEGNHKQKLSEIKGAQDVSIIDDWIYFDAYGDSGWSLYRVKTDGSIEEKIESPDIKTVLKGLDSPVVDEDMVALFYDYLAKSSSELRLMPNFDSSKKPDWDALTQFVFIMCDQVDRDDEGTFILTKNAFEETVKRLFAEDFDYAHRSSTYLTLAGDVYTPTGWDVHGAVYYRLYELKKVGDNTFKAAFDGFSFGEMDFFGGPFISENMQALVEYAGEEAEVLSRNRWDDLMLEVLQGDNYAEILKKDQQVEITFNLSDDPVYAFKYLSCKRSYMGQ